MNDSITDFKLYLLREYFCLFKSCSFVIAYLMVKHTHTHSVAIAAVEHWSTSLFFNMCLRKPEGRVTETNEETIVPPER